jgi:hypothetical protein
VSRHAVSLFAAGFALASVGACGRDWDRFDPRVTVAPTPTGTAGSGGDVGSGGQSGTGVGSGSGGASSASGGGGSGGDGGVGGAGGAVGGLGGMGGAGGMPVLEVSYEAAVADCIEPAAPDPDLCETNAGAGLLDVDQMALKHSYLRFDLDNQPTGKTVLEVRLVVVVADTADAESDQSGEVWEVAPFDRLDLFAAAPAAQGMAPIAVSQGAVTMNQQVDFLLPLDLVQAGGVVFLGVLPVSTDGVNYFNNDGAIPPRLVVKLQ